VCVCVCVRPVGSASEGTMTPTTGWDAAQALRRGAENERLRGELHLQRTEKSEIFRHGSLVARAVRGLRPHALRYHKYDFNPAQ